MLIQKSCQQFMHMVLIINDIGIIQSRNVPASLLQHAASISEQQKRLIPQLYSHAHHRK